MGGGKMLLINMLHIPIHAETGKYPKRKWQRGETKGDDF